MSEIPLELPSWPESVLAMPLQDYGLGSTGFEPTTHTNRKLLKSRRRSQIMHDNVRTPIEDLPNSLFDYFQKEAERKEDATCVFLLWGSRDYGRSPTWAVDVQTTGLENEEKIFQTLAQRYSAERGVLQRYFSLKEYDKLEPVTFRIICRSSGKCLVSMEPLDLAKYRTIYLARQEVAASEMKTIADFNSDPDSDCCSRDHTGIFNHNNVKCPVNSSPGLASTVCPFEEWYTCKDRLRWIDTANFLSFYFRNPAGAYFQQILNAFTDHRFIYDYRDVGLSEDKFRPQNRYLSFNGLYLKTRFNISRSIYVFAGLMIFVVLGGKLVWNSWEIVFGAGSFFVAIPMLAMMAITFTEA